MAQQIKAIETAYNGYRFRSRMEARWAVFFDTLGIEYEYEKEGYDLGAAGWYLPDFWLPQVEMWAEVKPTHLTDHELEKAWALSQQSRHGCLLLVGSPAVKWYYGADAVSTLPGYWDYVLSGVAAQKRGRFGGSVDMCTDELERGVIAARSARFEHGEPHIS